MADYNVNMKQWNGTSFDNVLPLAYNAKQLEGQSLAEIKRWVHDNGLLLYTGQYTGTGTYGESNAKSVTFPFEPIIFIHPTYDTLQQVLLTNLLTTSYKSYQFYALNNNGAFLKKSNDGKTIYWYGNSANSNFNNSGVNYYFAAIGGYDMGGQTEWIITQSGTWTVPRTGRYMLELYGGGGSTTFQSRYQGGSSCQSYDSISLTTGDVVDVTIGAGLDSAKNGTRGGTTTFGQYSVLGGEKGGDGAGGAGSGNKGTDGQYVSSWGAQNNSTGILGQTYGYGVNGVTGGYSRGGNGAVYLKYLGA